MSTVVITIHDLCAYVSGYFFMTIVRVIAFMLTTSLMIFMAGLMPMIILVTGATITVVNITVIVSISVVLFVILTSIDHQYYDNYHDCVIYTHNINIS